MRTTPVGSTLVNIFLAAAARQYQEDLQWDDDDEGNHGHSFNTLASQVISLLTNYETANPQNLPSIVELLQYHSQA